MSWSDFKLRYKDKLSHVAGFEEKFVDLVLAKIPNLTPNDVIPQYHFVDSRDGNRYVDFMIINAQKNWCLPIELDGYAKMVGNGEEYHRFNDFLERQNAMIDKFGLVLRYTNKKMLNQPEQIIKEISNTLHKQSQDKSTKEIQEQHTRQMIADYEHKIQELTQNNNSQPLNGVLQDIQKELQALKSHQNKPQVAYQPPSKPPYMLYGAIVGIVVLAIGFVLTKEPTPTSPQTTSVEHIAEQSQTSNICGVVAEAKSFKGGVYLNLGNKYPNQTMSLKVWKQSNLDEYIGKEICTYGKIETFKGKPFINVNSLKAITIKN